MCEKCEKLLVEKAELSFQKGYHEGRANVLQMTVTDQQKTIETLLGLIANKV